MPTYLFTLSFSFIYRLLDKSPRWLIEENRSEEALKILHKVAHINKKELPENITFSNKIEEVRTHAMQQLTSEIRTVIINRNDFHISDRRAEYWSQHSV